MLNLKPHLTTIEHTHTTLRGKKSDRKHACKLPKHNKIMNDINQPSCRKPLRDMRQKTELTFPYERQTHPCTLVYTCTRTHTHTLKDIIKHTYRHIHTEHMQHNSDEYKEVEEEEMKRTFAYLLPLPFVSGKIKK